ncbi:GNAT family N-acetyltransferase [Aestuariirhabdus sp. Z084]|uniref:GNAT family N-acetyltransferase n=1 Tax=Aestuariirhabdus haliotis TaxID=2918751 RepID=UPI00201B4495|nr:GNAT family N-acetyltransferase [Aestuariirhabdus haliotis]MCL6417508.1 GNAT family N-acetyltransferase [Aestuariirhabdus haliotis]MCL6421448.1 GNAT family N-acetyltransferase [Aestuariirhabdus haliotis]
MAELYSDPGVRVETYRPEDAHDLADLFHAAVHGIEEMVYSANEREAWAPTPPDYQWWQQRLNEMNPHVAWMGGELVGFASVLITVKGHGEESTREGHIDCLYVAPDCQRRGIALALFNRCLEQFLAAECIAMTVDASKLAQPFFRRQGFEVVAYNRVSLRGEHLFNCTMRRNLS